MPIRKGMLALALVLVLISQALATPVPAPDLVGEMLKGGNFNLSYLQGMFVVLSFWTTWCHYCQKEMPQLVKLQAELNNRNDVRFVLVNVAESDSAVERFLRTNQLSFNTILDKNQKISNSFRINGYPSTIFISRDGLIVGRRVGMMNWQTPEARKVLDTFLRGEPIEKLLNSN